MNPINKVAGLILGAVTGALTAVLQIPYAYYLFAKNRRAARYSWPTTLLATATIGSVFALGTGILSIPNSWGIIGWGMKTGFAKGIMGAITLPYAFHTEFQSSLALGNLWMSGLYFIFDSDSRGNFSPSSLKPQAESQAKQARHQTQLEEMKKEPQAMLELIDRHHQEILLAIRTRSVNPEREAELEAREANLQAREAELKARQEIIDSKWQEMLARIHSMPDSQEKTQKANNQLPSVGKNEKGLVATQSTLFGEGAATTQGQPTPNPTGSNTPTNRS
jgi:hypothetical protein